MPATPARIGFIQSEFRKAVSITETAKARYGNLARESDDPIETFFDDVSDAQTMADARQALLSPDRQKFLVTTNSLIEAQAVSYVGAVPEVRFIDSERSADKLALIADMTIDYNRQAAAIRVWG